ncbi:hypothetical protein BpHYR1_036124 [Brachionus plicatilis]|uniref:Uncharacterized protein n=1 Tax=Brachionus plicatilis TaxID=10195 RepID=A0A3M7S5I6_BRAPC|nr:hypothetical protein BpHYR1_036124 [Brachionus plicatilis]
MIITLEMQEKKTVITMNLLINKSAVDQNMRENVSCLWGEVFYLWGADFHLWGPFFEPEKAVFGEYYGMNVGEKSKYFLFIENY